MIFSIDEILCRASRLTITVTTHTYIRLQLELLTGAVSGVFYRVRPSGIFPALASCATSCSHADLARLKTDGMIYFGHLSNISLVRLGLSIKMEGKHYGAAGSLILDFARSPFKCFRCLKYVVMRICKTSTTRPFCSNYFTLYFHL